MRERGGVGGTGREGRKEKRMSTYFCLSLFVDMAKYLGCFSFQNHHHHINFPYKPIVMKGTLQEFAIALVVKNLSASVGDPKDMSSIPGLGSFPGVGNGTPLQCSCLENSISRGAWWATVHRAQRFGRD